jgi:hypothetical protein
MTPTSMPPGGSGRPSPGTTPRPPVGGVAPPGGPMGGPMGAPPNNAPTANAPPPKKGPKTFEEMGVPQGKTESDCVSFVSV